METIKSVAFEYQNNINIKEDLRERAIGNFAPMTFKEAKHQVFKDFHFSFPGGESSTEAQKRAVNVITSIIESNKGRKIVIGTHGDIMTLMLNHFDNRYGYSFWESTSMPDIYKLTLDANKLIAVERMWGNGER
ncbi:histidine phosphatase family protein [Paenibacillus sp. GXUN7292]|uniref:histidine phosphatase family protein n=1 Tax=Paenibacillus sp. GXUN7292 TaxID=3422499 RepID=UPI003D7E5863